MGIVHLHAFGINPIWQCSINQSSETHCYILQYILSKAFDSFNLSTWHDSKLCLIVNAPLNYVLDNVLKSVSYSSDARLSVCEEAKAYKTFYKDRNKNLPAYI